MTTGGRLSSLIDRELECLQALYEILTQEYQALLGTDFAAIERATAAKNKALATQAEASQAREQFAGKAALDIRDAAIQALLDPGESPEQLSAAIAQLNSLATQCQTANRHNGRLIMQKQLQARGALDILRQTDDKTPTYSSHGKALSAPTLRSLGNA